METRRYGAAFHPSFVGSDGKALFFGEGPIVGYGQVDAGTPILQRRPKEHLSYYTP